MRTAIPAAIASILVLVVNCGIAFCQQLAFTSREYIRSPVFLSSIESSREFGFESVVIRNDGLDAISAVHFKITLRTGSDDEVADERRVVVSIEHAATRRVVLELGHVEGLKQLVRSRKQATALAILTVEQVEFEDGHEWRQAGQQEGVPLDVPLRK